jgi:hypothetical protein
MFPWLRSVEKCLVVTYHTSWFNLYLFLFVVAGCGKTLQAIALMLHYRQFWPVLIIVPAALLKQWPDEIKKYAGYAIKDSDIVVVGKSAALAFGRITIITYTIMESLARKKFITPEQFGVVIADESQNLKNKEAVRTIAILPFLKQATVALCMSGTPAVNRPVELFSQLSGVLPDVFGDYSGFVHRYCDAKPNTSMPGLNVSGHSNDKELNTILTGLAMIRRTKDMVNPQLPEKIRELRYVDPDRSSLAELKALNNKQKEIEQKLLNSHGRDQEDIQALSNQKQQLLMALYRLTGKSKIGAIVTELVKLIEEQRLARGMAVDAAAAAAVLRSVQRYASMDANEGEDDIIDAAALCGTTVDGIGGSGFDDNEDGGGDSDSDSDIGSEQSCGHEMKKVKGGKKPTSRSADGSGGSKANPVMELLQRNAAAVKGVKGGGGGGGGGGVSSEVVQRKPVIMDLEDDFITGVTTSKAAAAAAAAVAVDLVDQKVVHRDAHRRNYDTGTASDSDKSASSQQTRKKSRSDKARSRSSKSAGACVGGFEADDDVYFVDETLISVSQNTRSSLAKAKSAVEVLDCTADSDDGVGGKSMDDAASIRKNATVLAVDPDIDVSSDEDSDDEDAEIFKATVSRSKSYEEFSRFNPAKSAHASKRKQGVDPSKVSTSGSAVSSDSSKACSATTNNRTSYATNTAASKKEVGEKIIVFFHHKNVLSAIEDVLLQLRVKFIKVDGATTQKARTTLISAFQNDNVVCMYLATYSPAWMDGVNLCFILLNKIN